MKKKDEELPEEMMVGDRQENRERVKDVWIQAFSKLGKFDEDDKRFDREFYREVKEEVEKWEREREDRIEGELDRDVEMSEVEEALRKLENGKAAGVDECINEILKNGGEGLKDSLLLLFQKMWKEERVPKDWARGIIVPIFKEGDKRNADNYRGITLLSVVGKVYMSILNNRVSRWLESEKKLVEEQGGFRASRSTAEQIFILKETIRGRGRAKKKTYCCFLDIRKAYDTVFREGLWKRMLEKGIGGKCGEW